MIRLNEFDWKNFRLGDLFRIEKGRRLTLGKQINGDIPYISSSSVNNGVASKIGNGFTHENCITFAAYGSIGEVFYHPSKIWASDNVNALMLQNRTLSMPIAMFLVSILKKEKYRFSYGFTASKERLEDIEVKLPSKDSGTVPDWELMEKYILSLNIPDYSHIPLPYSEEKTPELKVEEWKEFRLDELFETSASKNISNKEAVNNPGDIPYLTTTGDNNGKQRSTSIGPFYTGNKLTIAGSGTILATFYQDKPFTTSQRLYILDPVFDMNQYLAMFLIPLIEKERYRFSYGRQVKIRDITNMVLKLPVDIEGSPDWKWMENYVKTLKFSKEL